jgi:hypothetical protein
MTSDEEGFLARWSRRKREAETTTPASPGSSEPATVPEASDHPPEAERPDVSDIVAQLPPIDEITAATDIRAFLAPGVPTELRLAALRRAWRADPAIRDFIGLAENQWDFNAPEGVPGFGSLLDPEQVRRLLAKVVGGDAREAPTSSSQASPPNGQSPDPQTAAEIAPAPEELNAAVASSSASEPGVPVIDQSPADVDAEADTASLSPRRHGGALPR